MPNTGLRPAFYFFLPLVLFLFCTWMSPIHVTFILFENFVFDPNNLLQVFISLLIAFGIWIPPLYLYYYIYVKIRGLYYSHAWGRIQFVCTYLVLYLASTSFLIYWLIKNHQNNDFILIAIQFIFISCIVFINRDKIWFKR